MLIHGGGGDARPAGLRRVRRRLRRDVDRAAARRRPRPMPARWPARSRWRSTVRPISPARRRRRRRWRRRTGVGAGAGRAAGRDITFPAVPSGGPRAARHLRQGRRLPQPARGNALPMFFGDLVGVTARVCARPRPRRSSTGNTTDCLKPWAIVDRWDECNGQRMPSTTIPATVDPDFNPAGQAPSTFDK